MVDNIVSKPLGLVLIITAHIAFTGASRAQITELPGNNVTLTFTFNVSVTQLFAVYIKNETKIAGYTRGKSDSDDANVYLSHDNTSVFCHIMNLTPNQSGLYSASLLDRAPVLKSNNEVQLTVLELSSTTDSLMLNTTTSEPTSSHTFFSSHTVIVLVVSPVVLLAALLPFVIWCLVRHKDSQPQPPPSSNHSVQETIEASNNVSASPPLVYSVLDFPKRPSAVMEINPNDTEYAAVHYLSEKRHM